MIHIENSAAASTAACINYAGALPAGCRWIFEIIPCSLQQDWRNYSSHPAMESFNYNFLKYKNFLIGEYYTAGLFRHAGGLPAKI